MFCNLSFKQSDDWKQAVMIPASVPGQTIKNCDASHDAVVIIFFFFFFFFFHFERLHIHKCGMQH